MSLLHTRIAAVAVASLALAAAGLATPLAAQAAEPTTSTALNTALGTTGSYALGGDITDNAQYTVGANQTVTLDLNGHHLAANNVTLGSGAKLTLTDTTATGGTLDAIATYAITPGVLVPVGTTLVVDGTAHLNATGTANNPGIGGGTNGGGSAAGTITIGGNSVVVAHGTGSTTNGPAGIGGASQGDGGIVTIQDFANVSALGGSVSTAGAVSGAGIGGGSHSTGNTVQIGGNAVVSATGGPGAPGIGGGGGAGMTSFSLGGAAQVTATPGPTPTGYTAPADAVGDGVGTVATLTMTLSSGTLTIPAGATQTFRMPVTNNASIQNSGTVATSSGVTLTIGASGRIIGGTIAGTVQNDGTVSGATIGAGGTVTHRNYDLVFDANGGSVTGSPLSVLAKRASDTGVTAFPTPTRAGYVFQDWKTNANGSGFAIDPTSDLVSGGFGFGISSTGTPVTVNLYARWKQITTTTLTLAHPSYVYDSGNTVAATVTPGSTGSVQYYLDDEQSSFASRSADLDTTVIIPFGTPVGTHTVRAEYSGDTTHLPSTASAPMTVLPIATTTTLLVAPSSVTVGAGVTATASVPSDVTGSVQFAVDDTVVATVGISSGTSIASLSPGVGAHTITATYTGDATHAASSDSAPLSVTAIATTTTVDVTPHPHYGSSLGFSAAVTGGGTGTVTFSLDGVVTTTQDVTQGTAAVTVILSARPGEHILVADYSGDATHASSSATRTITIEKSATATSVKVSAHPRYATKVTLTASVPGVTVGTVTFTVDGASVGTATLNNGVASKSVTLTAKPGKHTFGAVFMGDATNAASTGRASLTVDKAITIVTLKGGTFRSGTKPRVTVSLKSLANKAKPSGTVTIYSGNKRIATVKVIGSKTVTLPKATRTLKLVAKYAGSSTVAKSNSKTTTVKVRAK